MGLTPSPQCPGAGQPWGTGTGQPICPVCHRGARFFGVTPPRRKVGRTTGGRWTGSVPPHGPRKP